MLRLKASAKLTHIRRPLLLFVPIGAAVFLAATGCSAQPSPGKSATSQVFPPMETRSLRTFGAAGDGQTDDTLALRNALSKSDQYCLDGQGRAYRVDGTLRVTKNVCLRNLTLLQSHVPVDTGAYIRQPCPVTNDTSEVVDCGDPAIPAGQLAQLRESLSVRTLFIRPGAPQGEIRVILDRVKVDRGHYPQSGSRTDSAGIWIERVNGGDLNNVEITGAGKGVGLEVLRSRNLTVTNLSVHDLVWSPYAGDRPLVQSEVEATGWNSVPIHEFRDSGKGAPAAKFYGVRVQEQITCASFSEVQNVLIRNPRINRCVAHFTDGNLPWQADGLDISRSSSNVTVESPEIDTTWEGMDVVGNGDGVTNLVIDNAKVTNSFGFGLKLGRRVTNTRIVNPTIVNAGIAGIVIYGAASGMTVSGGTIDGVGIVRANGRNLEPWAGMPRAGLRLNVGPSGVGTSRAAPHDIEIDNLSIASSGAPSDYEFGLLNTGGIAVNVKNLQARGFRRAAKLEEPTK